VGVVGSVSTFYAIIEVLKYIYIVFVEDGLSFSGFSPGKILTFDKFFAESNEGFVYLLVIGTVNCMMVRSFSSGKGVFAF
jgi:hypothetical protein